MTGISAGSSKHIRQPTASQIRALLAYGLTKREIGLRYGMGWTALQRILSAVPHTEDSE